MDTNLLKVPKNPVARAVFTVFLIPATVVLGLLWVIKMYVIVLTLPFRMIVWKRQEKLAPHTSKV